MYMAYGWPQIIPLDSGLCPSSQKIVYLKVINRLLLVVSPSHFELWSSSQVFIHRGSCLCAWLFGQLGFPISEFWIMQHKVRLGKYKRDVESVEREGENLQAVWSPDAKLIAIIVSGLDWFDFSIWALLLMICCDSFDIFVTGYSVFSR